MSLQKRDIGKFIAAALTARPFFSSQAFPFVRARARPTRPENLPIGFVYSDVDQAYADLAEVGTAAVDRCGLRQIALSIVVLIENPHSEDVEDRLDEVEEEIEKGVLADTTAGGLCNEIRFSKSETFRDPSGDSVLGSLHVVFHVLYLRSVPVDGG